MRSRDSTQALWGQCPEGTLLHPPAHVPLSRHRPEEGAGSDSCAPAHVDASLLWALLPPPLRACVRVLWTAKLHTCPGRPLGWLG